MMRSPRFLRPHRVIIKNRIGEVEGDAQYQNTTINHVNMDTSYGINQSQKGIQPNGSSLLIIDMNDLVAFEGMKKRVYVEPLEFESLDDTTGYFTIRPDVDFILYKGKSYTVTSVTGPNPTRDEPEFLEVVANE